jgi:Autographiviridae endonuclease VII
MTSDSKTCSKCGRLLPLTAFNKAKEEAKHRAECRECQKAYAAAYRQANPEKQHAYALNKRLAYPTIGRAWKIRKKFGISLLEYEAIYHMQGGKCALCDTVILLGGSGKAALDHCHVTGRIRGFLCTPCNTSLGNLEPFIAEVLAYIKYQP